MVTISSEETPIACTLTPGDLQDRRDWIAALNADSLVSHRQTGRVLELRYHAAASPDVRVLAERERTCCPFLDFDLREASNEIVLIITAPKRADAMLEQVFAPFLSEVAAAPACACCAGGRR
jgi:hypothetical protein